MATTYLDLINEVDNVPDDFDYTTFYRLQLPPRDDRTHGYMTEDTVKKLPWTEDFSVDRQARVVRLDSIPNNASMELLSKHCKEAFQKLIDKTIDEDKFDILHGEHSEPYKVMGAKFDLSIERFTAPLFGIATRGAHMTAYTKSPSGEYKIWVPRRSAHLFTYPGKLDTSVAGGVKARHTPRQCIIEESHEEAALPKDFVASNAKSAGIITYMTQSKRTGAVHPDVLYVFDLELPEDMQPRPNDDEVSEFKLMTIDKVKDAMFNHEFKSNCNLVMIDFFIRHGIITSGDEKDYVQLQTKLHRKLHIPTSPDDS